MTKDQIQQLAWRLRDTANASIMGEDYEFDGSTFQETAASLIESALQQTPTPTQQLKPLEEITDEDIASVLSIYGIHEGTVLRREDKAIEVTGPNYLLFVMGTAIGDFYIDYWVDGKPMSNIYIVATIDFLRSRGYDIKNNYPMPVQVDATEWSESKVYALINYMRDKDMLGTELTGKRILELFNTYNPHK